MRIVSRVGRPALIAVGDHVMQVRAGSVSGFAKFRSAFKPQFVLRTGRSLRGRPGPNLK